MGTELSKELHLEELKKYNEVINSKKRVIFEGGVTAKQIMDKLEEVDEVVVKLGTQSILRVCQGFKYFINDVGYSMEQTSEETGQEFMSDYDTKKWVDVKPNWVFPQPRKALRTVAVYTNIPISNKFTGKQVFENKLQNILNNDNISEF